MFIIFSLFAKYLEMEESIDLKFVGIIPVGLQRVLKDISDPANSSLKYNKSRLEQERV